jgi:hypothetical protein
MLSLTVALPILTVPQSRHRKGQGRQAEKGSQAGASRVVNSSNELSIMLFCDSTCIRVEHCPSTCYRIAVRYYDIKIMAQAV